MVRNYKKKTNRALIDEGLITNAIKAVMKEGLSTRRAAELFNVKRSTLVSRMKKSKLHQRNTQDDSGNDSSEEEYNNNFEFSSKYTVAQVFTTEQENNLCDYLKKCSGLNYGLSYKQVRVLSLDFAKLVGSKKIPSQWLEQGMAGIDWLLGFMKRNKDLSLRKPENTSLARASGFNRPRVTEFFDKLRVQLDKYKFQPEQIYNLDESGVSTVTRPVKVVAPKGRKQVGVSTSAERGELVTFVGIICATGTYLPPVFIFPRVRNIQDYMIGGITSALALGNKTGWMTSELFLDVLKHIKHHSKCTFENKILLLIDNHKTHVGIQGLEFCKANGIVLLSFPPHCSHRMQPLDVGIYAPFKSKYATSCNDWSVANPGKTLSLRQVAHLVKLPFLNAFTPSNITKAFEKTGIVPFQSDVFTEDHFAPSLVTDIPTPPNETGDEAAVTPLASKSASTSSCSSEKHTNETSTSSEIPPRSDAVLCLIPSTIGGEKTVGRPTAANTSLTPDLVRPFPKCDPKYNNRTTNVNKKGATVYTDTPEVKKIKLMEEDKLARAQLKQSITRRKLFTKVKRSSTKESQESDSDSFASDDNTDEEELAFVVDGDQIDQGEFLLVQFATKKSIVYYVGHVEGQYGPTEFKIKFLRRRNQSSMFYFPMVDDVASVEISDIIAKLPVWRATRDNYTFNYKFNNLNVK